MDIIDKVSELFFTGLGRVSVIFAITPYDILFFSILFGGLFGFGLRYGVNKIFTLIVSLYFVAFVSHQFPYTEKLIGSQIGDVKLTALIIGLFLVFFAVIYIIFSRIMRATFSLSGRGRWFEVAILCLVTTTLIVAFLYHVFPLQSMYDFSDSIDSLFASSEAFFWWLVAPIAVVFFVGKSGGYVE